MPKRRQYPRCPSMAGIFTRRRSEIFLHRTRSGRARRGLSIRLPGPGHRPVSPLAGAGDMVSAFVKDLRARRIFSPSSIPIEVSPDKAVKVDPPAALVDNVPVVDAPVSISEAEHDGAVKLHAAVEEGGECRDMTVQDPPSFDKPSPPPQLESGTGIKGKLGILPCSRLKLFGNPSSLNYKRLLPYLMDLANDGGVQIIHPLKKEQFTEEKLSSPAVSTLGRQESGLHLASRMLESPADKPATLKSMEASNYVAEIPQPSESPLEKAMQNQTETSATQQTESFSISEGHDLLEIPKSLADTVSNSKAPIALTHPCNQPPLQVQMASPMGPFPCSRSKLFSNPASLNYKRLLPFLIDLRKDDSVGMFPSQNDLVEVEENMEENPLSQNQDSLSCEDSDTSFAAVPIASLDIVASPICETQVPETMPTLTQSEASILSCPNDICKTQQSDGLNACEIPAYELTISIPMEGDSNDSKMMTKPPTSCSDLTQQAPEKALMACPEADAVEIELICNSTFAVPSPTSGTLSVEELIGKVGSPLYSPGKDEINLGKIAQSLYEDTNAIEGTPPLKQIRTVGKHVLAPKKSILKRNMRGCIGLCTCLNCSSFRIHAERSFDFSRKQLLEADEVVNGLVKELSSLRGILTSATPTSGGVVSSTQHSNKVKRLSQRASRVEELAKDRLKQMFDDLNCHCRFPGPRVAFADCVEERLIP